MTPADRARVLAQQLALRIVGPGDPTDTEGPNAIGVGEPRRQRWAADLFAILEPALRTERAAVWREAASIAEHDATDRVRCACGHRIAAALRQKGEG